MKRKVFEYGVSEDKSGCMVYSFNGELVVANAEEIKEVLYKAASKYERITIFLNKPTIIDLSLIQLLISFNEYVKKINKEVIFECDLDDEMVNLMKIGGAWYLFEKNKNKK